jgi:hypothetical protein
MERTDNILAERYSQFKRLTGVTHIQHPGESHRFRFDALGLQIRVGLLHHAL